MGNIYIEKLEGWVAIRVDNEYVFPTFLEYRNHGAFGNVLFNSNIIKYTLL